MSEIRIHTIDSTVNPCVGKIVSKNTKEVWDILTEIHFLTREEILNDVGQFICEEDLKWIKEMNPSDLITLHDSFGRYIRNRYGLWHEKNPMVVKDDLGDGHPDGISQRIIEEFHKRLNPDIDKDAYENAMSIVVEYQDKNSMILKVSKKQEK